MAEEKPEAGRLEPAPKAVAEPAAMADKTPVVRDVDAIVEQWFRDYFPNSPIARDTRCWNLLFTAKDNLKQRLKGA